MNKPLPYQFASLSETLSQTALKMHASQVHGLISGLLCGQSKVEPDAWEALVTGEGDHSKAHGELQGLHEAVHKQLVDFLFEFDLLLPDDDTRLVDRAEALTVWCQGFLTGLKLANVPLTGRDPSELTEGIDDLVEIAKMNYEQVVESEEDEHAFAELVEYVRMVAVFIYQSLAGDNKQDDNQNQLH
jgi:yecA family protein